MNRRPLLLFYLGPVLVWLILIFLASTGMGAAEVTLRGLVHLLHLLVPDEAQKLAPDSVDKMNFLIRKCAHLSEYAILALLLARAIQFGASTLKWQSMAGALGGAVCYACTDEFHQIFVPGRTASPRDVLIDSIGATVALSAVLIWFTVKAYERRLWQKPLAAVTRL